MAKRMSKDEAVKAMAAILVQLGANIEIGDIAEEAVEIATQERRAARLRRQFKRVGEEGESWDAFVRASIDAGEWLPEWGTPAQQ